MDHLKKKESWKIFDEIFSSYDRINQVLSFGLDRKWRNAVAKKIAKEKPTNLLDLASGTADQLIAIMKKNPQIQKAVGIDLSKKMLEEAKKKIDRLNLSKKVTFFCEDACKLPFEDSSFEAISFSFGIRNMENTLSSLKEIVRVLKPNGTVYILEFSLPHRSIRPFYLFYLRHLLPWIGGVLSKNQKAYQYLNQTIETFPYAKAFTDLMEKAGLEKITMNRFSFGAVTLYTGKKS